VVCRNGDPSLPGANGAEINSVDARDANTIIAEFGLAPHPEGGYYRETYRDRPPEGRGVGTAILFLLEAGEVSHWHRVDAIELWVWQAGAPLELSVGRSERMILDATQLHGPVPANAWQSARSLGDWSLVSCVVMPAFDFAGFELAPPGWAPPVG
jgi:predicted cupin superfamily sugar epimerase